MNIRALKCFGIVALFFFMMISAGIFSAQPVLAQSSATGQATSSSASSADGSGVATGAPATSSSSPSGATIPSGGATSSSGTVQQAAATTTTSSSPKATSGTSVPIKKTAPALPAATYSPVIVTSSTGTPATNSTPEEQGGNTNIILAAALSVIAIAAGIYAALRAKTKPQKNDEEDHQNKNNACDNIKSLLEAKKEELKDMMQEMGEEKAVEAIGEENVLGKIAGAAMEVKEKYQELCDAIDMLEKRYNLCMLSLPEYETGSRYRGTIIKESVTDPAILENIEIETTHEAAPGRTLLNVLANEKQIEKLGACLKAGPWHMHFWKEDEDGDIVVFKEKRFEIKNSDAEARKAALSYAAAKGIPRKELGLDDTA